MERKWPCLEDLEDDPELHALHKERIQALKEEQEKRGEKARKGHGRALHGDPASDCVLIAYLCTCECTSVPAHTRRVFKVLSWMTARGFRDTSAGS